MYGTYDTDTIVPGDVGLIFAYTGCLAARYAICEGVRQCLKSLVVAHEA